MVNSLVAAPSCALLGAAPQIQSSLRSSPVSRPSSLAVQRSVWRTSLVSSRPSGGVRASAVDVSKIVPQADRILIRLDTLSEQSTGGVLLPRSAVKYERYLIGEVLATGSEVEKIEKGSKVLVSDINAYEVNLGTPEKLCFARASDLLAVVEARLNLELHKEKRFVVPEASARVESFNIVKDADHSSVCRPIPKQQEATLPIGSFLSVKEIFCTALDEVFHMRREPSVLFAGYMIKKRLYKMATDIWQDFGLKKTRYALALIKKKLIRIIHYLVHLSAQDLFLCYLRVACKQLHLSSSTCIFLGREEPVGAIREE